MEPGQITDVAVAHKEFLAAMGSQLREAENVLARCGQLPLTPGTGKLRRRLQAEIRFYNQCLKGHVKSENLTGNNLPYLSSLVDCALQVSDLEDIIKPFAFPDNHQDKSVQSLSLGSEWSQHPERVVVDIVADGGRSWIKVVARNPGALLSAMLGEGEYGRRTLLHQVQELVACSRFYPHLFVPPEVKVIFTGSQEPPQQLVRLVEETGAQVLFNSFLKQNSPFDGEDRSSRLNEKLSTFRALRLQEVPENSVLNLDVSTMLAYISALTNGRAHFRFQENQLTEQAENERMEPVKPALDHLFKNRKLICCQNALKDFLQITKVMAGPMELCRAESLLRQVEVVQDEPSARSTKLGIKGKIKRRSLIIFGTGDLHKAITITANIGFLRAAAGQGVHFVAFVHPSRALTENKESTAIVL